MASSHSYIPYGTQWIDEDDIATVVEVLRSGYLTQGPTIVTFERAIADYVGANYCVAFCNATAALHSAVKALEIPMGMEGITSTNTFVASANCLAYNGLKPVFADIDQKSFNVSANSLCTRITSNTRVLIPVHFAGQPCDMIGIAKLAHEFNLPIIEDAAHAIGSNYADGSRVGNCKHSQMTIFSFHPVKTITTGEGGAITTNDPKLYQRLLLLRSHGITKDPELLTQNPGPWYYEQQELGYNFRITDLQCALGLRQLAKLDGFKTRRHEIIQAYNQALADIAHVITPKEVANTSSCFHLYVLQIDFAALGTTRKAVMDRLAQQGIGTQVHYIPVHTQPWYRKTFGYGSGLCPNAEAYYEKALSLPLYPKMSDDDVDRVIRIFKQTLAP